MDALFGILIFILFICLIVGLTNPSIILRWTNKPTRLKFFGYWMLTMFLVGIIGAATTSSIGSSKIRIESANKNIEKGNYKAAIYDLNAIASNDSLYKEATQLLKIADSLQNLSAEEKKLAQQVNLQKEKDEKLAKQKEQIESEIRSINEGIDFSGYRKTIDLLTIEIALFGAWANIIKEGEASEDAEIQKLTKELKSKVVKIQLKEFPLVRKEYGNIVAKKMWENDIDVSTSGRRNNYLNFTGGVFAANKNKKAFQEQITEILTMLRFRQSRYRWYKGDDEYTYYTTYEGKDSELVFF